MTKNFPNGTTKVREQRLFHIKQKNVAKGTKTVLVLYGNLMTFCEKKIKSKNDLIGLVSSFIAAINLNSFGLFMLCSTLWSAQKYHCILFAFFPIYK